jgi:cyclopropane fatty-acyl-phospholipid synthase-like methyltransferase
MTAAERSAAREKGDEPMPEHDSEHHGADTTPAVARFYDTLRSGSLSTAALVHGDADIGQECLLTPEEILDFARRAGMTAGTFVLDIGSGTGGPACYLAQQLGCRILGVDISTVGHAQALARAHDTALSHLVQFQCGDIATLPLPEATFDVILGLDAWCHISQRALLFQRCATLLRPQGRLAFYDHVVCQPLPPEEYQHFCQLWRFPGLETPQSYRAALQGAGFRILAHDVTSAYAVRFYSRLLTLYTERRTEFEAMRGPARYQEGLERLQMSQRFATTGHLGQLACIAEQPGETVASAVMD